MRVLVAHLGGVVDGRLGNLTGWTIEAEHGVLRLGAAVR
jgi:hypothetical protein